MASMNCGNAIRTAPPMGLSQPNSVMSTGQSRPTHCG